MEESESTLGRMISFGNFGKSEDTASPSPILVDSADQAMMSSCRICLSNILVPARLICGHKFCESCLNKYWKATDEPNVIVCPLCRNYTCKIGFTQKSYGHSIKDFRKKFDPDYVEMPSMHVIQSKSVEVHPRYMSYLTWVLPVVILPTVYFVFKLVKPLVLGLFSNNFLLK